MAYPQLGDFAIWDEPSSNPLWRRTDELPGQNSGNYAIPVNLLVGEEVVPEKLFAVLNLIYQPSFLRPNSKWEDEYILSPLSPAVHTQFR